MLLGMLAASLFSATLPASDVDCLRSLGRVLIDGNLNIAVPCELDGTTVSGDVRIFGGGSLTADNARIEGNLQARTAAFVVLTETIVDGNVRLDELVGDRSRIALSHIEGNVHLTGNRSRLEIEDSRVDGNLRVNDNTGGASILRNSIDGNLVCRRNSPPPTGGDNVVIGNAVQQCASLAAAGTSSPPPSPPVDGGSGSQPSPPPSDPDAGSGGGAPPSGGGSGPGEQPAPGAPVSGAPGSGGSTGPGSNELTLDPRPSGGGAAVGPLETLTMLVSVGLLSLLKTRRRKLQLARSRAPALLVVLSRS